MMPIGPILLLILLVLGVTGFLDGILDRMHLTPRSGALLLGAALVGSLVELPLGPGLSVSAGAGLIPLAFAFYLLLTADRWQETLRAVAGGVVTAGAVFLLGRWFPPGQPTELNLFYLDAQYLFGVAGGLIGFLAGFSRRAAYCAAVLGVLLSDLAHYARVLPATVPPGPISIGGGGFQGTAVVAGILAILLVELVGEEVRSP